MNCGSSRSMYYILLGLLRFNMSSSRPWSVSILHMTGKIPCVTGAFIAKCTRKHRL